MNQPKLCPGTFQLPHVEIPNHGVMNDGGIRSDVVVGRRGKADTPRLSLTQMLPSRVNHWRFGLVEGNRREEQLVKTPYHEAVSVVNSRRQGKGDWSSATLQPKAQDICSRFLDFLPDVEDGVIAEIQCLYPPSLNQ